MLGGLVASPTKYAPHRNMQLARERQTLRARPHARGQVHLRRRVPGRARRADRARRRERPQSPRIAVLRRARAPDRDRSATATSSLFKGGLRFYSTLDTQMQAAAEGALRKGLESLDRRLGFRGPIGAVPDKQRGAWTGGAAHPLSGANDDTSALADQVLPEQRYGAMIVELHEDGRRDRRPRAQAAAARRQRCEGRPRVAPTTKDTVDYDKHVALGDLLAVRLGPDGTTATLAQRPALQGSLVAIEPNTGRVLALVGGYDWTSSQFDRATQAHRQVGSSIKPLIYALVPRVGPHARRAHARWPVLGHDGDRRVDAGELRQQVHGRRHADDRARVLAQHDQRPDRGAGRPRSHHRDDARVRDHLADPPSHLDRARHARSHAARDRRGVRRHRERRPQGHPTVLRSRHRHRRQRRRGSARPAARPAGDLARGRLRARQSDEGRRPARYGAVRAGARPTRPPARPARARTSRMSGSTASPRTSSARVWVGRDDSTPIGDKVTGGGTSVPIWLDFMQKAHPRTKIRDFPVPPGVSFARVEPWSGDPAGPSPEAVWMPFVRGTLPQKFLSGPALRSFDDVVPAPAVPRPPAKCNTLSCL